MPATTHYFNGTCYWAKLNIHNLDTYNDKKSAQIEVVLDKDQLKALKATGSKLQPKLMDDGTLRVRFKRQYDHPIDDFGGLPTVIDSSGVPFNDLIGNGSKVTIKVTVYDSKMGKGTRLESVRVDELVPYDPDAKEVSASDTQFLVGVPF